VGVCGCVCDIGQCPRQSTLCLPQGFVCQWWEAACWLLVLRLLQPPDLSSDAECPWLPPARAGGGLLLLPLSRWQHQLQEEDLWRGGAFRRPIQGGQLAKLVVGVVT